MQEPLDEEEENLDDIHAENEIKKIKLALEHGMDLSKSLDGSGLPPEIEGQFLDYVQKWEDAYANQKMILIYDFVGRPVWKPVAELSDDEVVGELKTIMDVLNKNSIRVDTICDVEDRELYRFITEELFNLETNDIRLEGMMQCYIYEDFHPNHEFDIRNRCTELVEYITDKEKDSSEVIRGLDDRVWYKGVEYTKEEVSKKVNHFRDAFGAFGIEEFEFTSVVLNDSKNEASVCGHLHYSGEIEGSPETMDFDGACLFGLKREYDWWVITRFELPGVM